MTVDSCKVSGKGVEGSRWSSAGSSPLRIKSALMAAIGTPTFNFFCASRICGCWPIVVGFEFFNLVSMLDIRKKYVGTQGVSRCVAFEQRWSALKTLSAAC